MKKYNFTFDVRPCFEVAVFKLIIYYNFKCEKYTFYMYLFVQSVCVFYNPLSVVSVACMCVLVGLLSGS